MKKLSFKIIVPAMLLIVASGSGVAAEPGKDGRTVNEVATYQGADRQTRLVDGAKKEGDLSVYFAHPIVQKIMGAFTQKYGIKVTSWRGGSEAIQQRVMAESRAGKNDVDIIINTAMDTEGDRREKLLQEVRSPYQQDLVPSAVPAHRQWATVMLDVYSAGYNTKLIKKEELPKTYQDLLDPKWKGRLGVEANDHMWLGALMDAMGEESTRKLFDTIVATNGISVRKGHSLLTTMVASGEVPLALTVYSWNPEQLKRKGAPVEVHFIAPVFGIPTAIEMLIKAPHPNAAVLFYDFMLTDGEKILADATYVPTSTKVVSPLANVPVKIIDPVHALEMQDKWVKIYEDTITKKAR